jgi:dTDP-4-dehydrorhamnose 3,5-epimerase
MIFTETKLGGAFVIEPRRFEDIRGFFARSWSEREFAEHGIEKPFVEANISFSKMRGTLRGMHFQTAPRAQAKLVRCTRGAIYDVIIDLRPGSETFGQWVGVELTADNRLMLYAPEGCAHGFQTLIDDTEVFYQVSDIYAPEYADGIRWNDPAFGIKWPEEQLTMLPRDRQYPDFKL